MAACIENASVVYHLTAGDGESWADFERDYVAGARNVANACLKHCVGRLIYASSIAALYLGRKGNVGENASADTQPLRRAFYARAKIEAEGLLLNLYRSQRLPLVIVRPGIVMGRGGVLEHSGIGFWRSPVCCLAWGRGTHPLPFVLVDDVVDALVSASDAPEIEGMSFQLAGDVFLSARDFVDAAAERARRNFRCYPQSLLKMQAIEILKWLLKAVARKPENGFPSYRDLASRSLASQLDCSAAKRKLGWRPNSSLSRFLEEAIDPHLRVIAHGDLRLLERTPGVA